MPDPLTPFTLTLLVLASARVTHLLTTDTIAEPVRLLFARTDWGNTLIHCPWCIGFWVSVALTTLLVALPHPLVYWALTILAVSWALAFLEHAVEALTADKGTEALNRAVDALIEDPMAQFNYQTDVTLEDYEVLDH